MTELGRELSSDPEMKASSTLSRRLSAHRTLLVAFKVLEGNGSASAKESLFISDPESLQSGL